MFRKFIIFILLLILFSNCIILADDEIENADFSETKTTIETVGVVSDSPKINSRYAVVIDRNTNTILYGKNENKKTKMASTTKIMTSLVVIENSSLDDIVEVSAKAAGTGGSRLKLNKGDKVTVNDLLYGLMLRSGNDAAVALAEYVGGNIDGFSKLMNKKAEELGLTNTHFETPHGLDSNEHYTTPYELAILTNYALNNETFAKIVNTKTCTITIDGIQRAVSNTNELLGVLNGVYGVKTGFTNGAGRCLVTSIKRENLDIICVVLGADTKKIRTTDSIKLIEYTFKTYENININEIINNEFEHWQNENCSKINIEKGIKNNINLKLDEYNLSSYPIEINTIDEVYVQIEIPSKFQAPVRENQVLGKLKVFYNDNLIKEINILASGTVNKKNIFSYMLEMVSNYNKYCEHFF